MRNVDGTGRDTVGRAWLLVFCIVAVPAFAQSLPLAESPPSQGYELHEAPAVDLSVTGAAAAAWLLTETVFKKSLAPASCRWCDRAVDGTDALNPVDAWGRGIRAPTLGGQRTADVASSVVDYVALPLALVGTETLMLHRAGTWRHVGEDVMDIAEAVTLAGVLNQAVKFAAGRERPFVHVLPAGLKPLTASPADNNVSFYSGHSSFAFSLIVATGTVAMLRAYPGSEWIWVVGLPIATAAPILRMVADKHYLTDVVVGSVVGAAVGFVVPYFLHARRTVTLGGTVDLRLTGDGVALTW